MPKRNPELAARARRYLIRWRDHFKRNIDTYHKFFPFVMGQQWEDEEEQLLKTYKKVPLTMNKLGSLVNTRLGEQQANVPDLQIDPDDSCDVKTAEVRRVLINHISQSSDAHIVYDKASFQAMVGSFGAFGVDTRYVDETSFLQELYIHDVQDPTKCFWDIAAKSPCKTDGMHSGYEIRMSREQFRQLYGRDIERSIQDITSDDYVYNFSTKDDISIIYFYEREYKTSKLYKLSNGIELDSAGLKELEAYEDENGHKFFIHNGEPVRIENRRETHKFVIKQYEVAGEYELNSSETPFQQLPLIFVDQNSWQDKQGRQITKSFVADVFDAQRFLNYLATQAAYLMKVSRYDQFLVSKNNVKSADTQEIWRDPGSFNGGLVYDVDVSGNTRPERLNPPELPQSMIVQYERTLDDIHSGTGMYQTRLGGQGQEVSGIAIEKREDQGTHTSNPADNKRNLAIMVAGQIINEAIPKVYDTERVMMLMMPDTGMAPVTLNKQPDIYGNGDIENDMTKGTYQVRLVPGPNSDGQKRQELEAMGMLLQAAPQHFNFIADIFAESLPIKNSIELRNRFRTLVSPEILEAGKTGKPVQQQGPNPQEQAMQMEMQFKQAELQLKAKEIELKEQEAKLKMEVELQKIQEERLKIAAQLEEQQLRYAAEMHRTRSSEEIAHANNLARILTHAKPPEYKEKTEK